MGEEWLDWDGPAGPVRKVPGRAGTVDVGVGGVVGVPGAPDGAVTASPRGHTGQDQGRGRGRGRKVLAALVPGRLFADRSGPPRGVRGL